MSEGFQITIGIVFLILVYILTRYGIAWKMRRVTHQIIEDLRGRGAVDANSAVPLPYEKVNYLHIGMRDYRPKVLASLVQEGYVGRTEEGKYFLQLPDFSGQEPPPQGNDPSSG